MPTYQEMRQIAMKLPETPEEVRQFVMSDYCALKFGREDFKPCEDDVYTMTAHDLLSAFDNWKLTQEPVPNEPASRLERFVVRLFPTTVERLRRLDALKTKCEKIAEKWRAMRLTNFGTTGTELELMYHGLALEFHREKYWWMKSLPALPHNAAPLESAVRGDNPGRD